jgi:hypothetical protein
MKSTMARYIQEILSESFAHFLFQSTPSTPITWNTTPTIQLLADTSPSFTPTGDAPGLHSNIRPDPNDRSPVFRGQQVLFRDRLDRNQLSHPVPLASSVQQAPLMPAATQEHDLTLDTQPLASEQQQPPAQEQSQPPLMQDTTTTQENLQTVTCNNQTSTISSFHPTTAGMQNTNPIPPHLRSVI